MTDTNNILANPAPLGLLGFGVTTVLLNFHNTGAYGVSAMILGMGIFYGGLAQIIAGIMEFKKGNTFGTTAFTSYGLFWISLVALWLLPSLTFISSGSKAVETEASFMAWYFFMWGLFTFCMFFATLKKNTGLQVIFGSLSCFSCLLFETGGISAAHGLGMRESSVVLAHFTSLSQKSSMKPMEGQFFH
jgi:succinate-acetate transporter protein